MLTIVRLNARVQKYNLTAANYGLNCSKYYVSYSYNTGTRDVWNILH